MTRLFSVLAARSDFLLLSIEAVIVVWLCAVAFRRPRFGASFFRKFELSARGFARHRTASALAVGAAAILIRAALLPIAPIPDPGIHDDFGQLLLADTFAAGRLANPPHPYWQHFESIYILQQPTYASQYQVATGLVLAAGQVVFGHPWWGLLFAMGLMCSLLCWALQAWLPPAWALLGGVLAVLQFAIVSYWINSYWGGTVPAIGGLLVVGGLARLRTGARLPNAVLIALGIAILMNSRPVEALLFGCVTCAVVLWWVFKTAELKLLPTARQVLLPMAAVLSCTLAGMMYYNLRVTGKPLELPYMLHQRVYGSPQPFFWQRPFVITSFRHKELKDEYLRQIKLWRRRSSVFELIKTTVGRTRDFWCLYLGPALTVPLLFFAWSLRDRGMPLILAIAAPFVLDYYTFFAFFPHYAAPVLGLTMIVVLQGWRHLRVWRRNGKPVGLFLSRTLPLVCVFGVVLVVGCRTAAAISPERFSSLSPVYEYFFQNPQPRSVFERELQKMSGRHLVFVHYDQPGHSPDIEWVYNRADIDHADVVWAREMGPASDRELIRYFSDRTVWVAEPDAKPPRLSRYPVSSR